MRVFTHLLRGAEKVSTLAYYLKVQEDSEKPTLFASININRGGGLNDVF
jgi:hypothetical protein